MSEKMRRGTRVVAALAAAAVVTVLAGCGGTAGGSGGDGAKAVTLYTADGLGDWYKKRFADFKAKTGVDVQIVEAGSGEVVSRLEKEKANPQADVVVTLPPFIQRAASKDLLTAYQPAGSENVPATGKDAKGRYGAMMNNYLNFVYNPQAADPAPQSWHDLLDPKYAKKIQYSTPGQAGDGTAVLLQLQHVYGDQGALDYLGKLEPNNVGPSSSTGKLQPKVGKGELLVANGDVQMNLSNINDDKDNLKIFFPADDKGERSTFAIPYYAGLATGAPHADNGKKLLDFLFSQEVQTSMSEAYGQPTRTDVHPSGQLADQFATTMQGVSVWTPDWDAVLAKLDADVAAYNKAVGK